MNGEAKKKYGKIAGFSVTIYDSLKKLLSLNCFSGETTMCRGCRAYSVARATGATK
jgi:hypothetical protein